MAINESQSFFTPFHCHRKRQVDELRAHKGTQLAELYLQGKLLYAVTTQKVTQQRFSGVARSMDKPRQLTLGYSIAVLLRIWRFFLSYFKSLMNFEASQSVLLKWINTMSDDSHQPQYIKLRNFESPKMPTQRAFQIFLSKALMLLKKEAENDEAAISSDRLHKTSGDSLNMIAPRPAFGSLLKMLDENLADWLHTAEPNDTLKVIVLPPCDEMGLIQSWAERNGLECLEPPTPQAILSGEAVLPDISGSSAPLVIPCLEAWMMRTYYGLGLIRQLLSAIGNTERRVVMGCNIYAWEFLKKAVNAASFLPDPMTFEALNSDQLRDWFYSLHSRSEDNHYTLCHQKTAQDIFIKDNDDHESYFKILAATSLGIPWVAWHLWRGSLLTQKEEPESDDTESNEKTGNTDDDHLPASHADQQILWVAGLQEFSLPSSTNDLSLLVLQAILIHHEISVDHLVKVLPDIRPLSAIPLLKRAGIIEQKQDILSCKPEAYPAIRAGLVASGFPTGVF